MVVCSRRQRHCLPRFMRIIMLNVCVLCKLHTAYVQFIARYIYRTTIICLRFVSFQYNNLREKLPRHEIRITHKYQHRRRRTCAEAVNREPTPPAYMTLQYTCADFLAVKPRLCARGCVSLSDIFRNFQSVPLILACVCVCVCGVTTSNPLLITCVSPVAVVVVGMCDVFVSVLCV